MHTLSHPAGTPTPSCYAGAEARLNRWLEKYQRDRAAHEKARRSHADPAKLDADFACVVEAMKFYAQGPLRPADLRAATALLHGGARATFHDSGIPNLGDIVDLLETHTSWWAQSPAVIPELAAFLEALTSSGSVGVLTNRRYSGNGETPLPLFVLHSVTVGDPWGPWGCGPPPSQVRKFGSSQDRAFRRVCFRLLARMAFLSAERSLGRGATHPFMVLLETRHGPTNYHGAGEVRPLELDSERLLALHPVNRAAFLQVLFLMIFVHRRFPWPPHQQYGTDARYRDAWRRSTGPWDFIKIINRMMGIVLTVPGAAQALVVDDEVWHVLATYGAGIRTNDSKFGHCCLNFCFRSKIEEDKLVALLGDTLVTSSWLCGEIGRFVLLEVCRQRRRRVVQVMIRLARRVVGHPMFFLNVALAAGGY